MVEVGGVEPPSKHHLIVQSEKNQQKITIYPPLQKAKKHSKNDRSAGKVRDGISQSAEDSVKDILDQARRFFCVPIDSMAVLIGVHGLAVSDDRL